MSTYLTENTASPFKRSIKQFCSGKKTAGPEDHKECMNTHCVQKCRDPSGYRRWYTFITGL